MVFAGHLHRCLGSKCIFPYEDGKYESSQPCSVGFKHHNMDWEHQGGGAQAFWFDADGKVRQVDQRYVFSESQAPFDITIPSTRHSTFARARGTRPSSLEEGRSSGAAPRRTRPTSRRRSTRREYTLSRIAQRGAERQKSPGEIRYTPSTL